MPVFKLPRFRSDESGGASIELVFMTPIIFFVFVTTLVFFDGYRSRFEAEAATNTLADMVSRETTTLSDDYLDGLIGVFSSLTNRPANEQLRLSVVQYDRDADRYQVSWSQSRGDDLPPLPTGDINSMRDEFPIMGHLDNVILLETKVDYVVPSSTIDSTILDDFEISNSIVVSPRFATTVCYASDGATNPTC